MSNSNYKLTEPYPLKPEVIVPQTDLSKGFQRSMPIEYDRTGRYRPTSQGESAIGWVIVMAIGLAIWSVVS